VALVCELHCPRNDPDGTETVAAKVVCWADTQLDAPAAEVAVKNGGHHHNVDPVM
jgi:hypothetical protein